MNRLFYNISIAFSILSTPFGAFALNFSVDSIRAFDGKSWNWGRDDSTILTNSLNYSISIDSIIIQIDNSLYNHYDIGWIEKSVGSSKVRIFDNDSSNLSFCITSRLRINIFDYNNGKSLKISIPAHSSITMYSPYFSSICSNVGVIDDCFEDCPPMEFMLTSAPFSGKIIFVSSKHRDTLHLLCERGILTTAVIKKMATLSPIVHSDNYPLVNMLGRKTGFANKLTAYHSLSVRKGNISILQ